MKSKVHFVEVKDSDPIQDVQGKLGRLLDKSGLLEFIAKDDLVAVKMHFGEQDNTGFVKPDYLGVINNLILKKQATPVLADSNTLYGGRRTNSSEHLKLAYEHGFTKDKAGAEVLIPDDTLKKNIAEVTIGQRFIKVAKVMSFFVEAQAIIGVAHFKGHLMTGFGGALKNIGMGCAAREGKLAQHSDIAPVVLAQNCVGCEACVKVCPVKAISIKDKKSQIDSSKCIGCASCIASCPYLAIGINWEAGGSKIQEKMIEYTKAVLDSKLGKCAFINFAIKITKECDCLAKDDPRIAPDIGIFASSDPVSIDKACFDLVNKASGRDIFKEAHPNRDGLKQLFYAEKLGLGSLDYELCPI